MDRIYRFSIPGICFLIGFWFTLFSLTGRNFLDENDSRLIQIFLPLLISSPIIGIILTSFLQALLHLVPNGPNNRCGPYWLYLPREIDGLIFRRFSPTQVEPQTKENWAKFYRDYQAYSRQNLESETFNFLSRRWTYGMIHVNNIWALGLSFFYGGIVSFHRSIFPNFNSSLFLLGIAMYGLYLIAGLYLFHFAWNDARNVEHNAIMTCLEKESTDRLRQTQSQEPQNTLKRFFMSIINRFL